ncbi:MAG TPA: hypothetical protein VK066_19985 [Chloroflexota bacterium]|nr:hypothetical protein [Chloroflexota bacterium]
MAQSLSSQYKPPLSPTDRQARALQRARDWRPSVLQAGPTTYAVPSRATKPGEWWYVEQGPAGALACGCDGYRYHGGCTHTAAVQLALMGELPVLTLPAPVRHAAPPYAVDPDDIFPPCQRGTHDCVGSVRRGDRRLYCGCDCHLPAPITLNEPE